MIILAAGIVLVACSDTSDLPAGTDPISICKAACSDTSDLPAGADPISICKAACSDTSGLPAGAEPISICKAACGDTSDLPVEKVTVSRSYVIDQNEASKIPPLFLISVNTLRSQAGLNDLKYSASLNAAAFTHAHDISLQNRPWHFGSDRSSPYFRVKRAGYEGTLLGENISESFETPINVIKSWTDNESTRANLLDPYADQLGVGWKQDPDARIWWVVLVGSSNKQFLPPENQPSELTEEAVKTINSKG